MTAGRRQEKDPSVAVGGARMKPDCTSRLVVIAKAYLGLIRDFARDHRFITVGLLATLAVHAAYEVWNRPVQPGEAPLALGVVVIAGYAGVILGAIVAFVKERRRCR